MIHTRELCEFTCVNHIPFHADPRGTEREPPLSSSRKRAASNSNQGSPNTQTLPTLTHSLLTGTWRLLSIVFLQSSLGSRIHTEHTLLDLLLLVNDALKKLVCCNRVKCPQTWLC